MKKIIVAVVIAVFMLSGVRKPVDLIWDAPVVQAGPLDGVGDSPLVP